MSHDHIATADDGTSISAGWLLKFRTPGSMTWSGSQPATAMTASTRAIT